MPAEQACCQGLSLLEAGPFSYGGLGSRDFTERMEGAALARQKCLGNESQVGSKVRSVSQ